MLWVIKELRGKMEGWYDGMMQGKDRGREGGREYFFLGSFYLLDSGDEGLYSSL